MAAESTDPQFYIAKAEDVFRGWTSFRTWISGADPYNIAADHYAKAASLYLTNKELSAEMRMKESEMLAQSSTSIEYKKHRIINAYKKAGGLFASIDRYNAAIEAYECALTHSASNNSVGYEIQGYIAGIYDKYGFIEKALDAYEKQAELLDDHALPHRHPLIKVAELSIHLRRYDRAIEIYEYLAQAYKAKGVAIFRGCDCLLMAGLCHIANDDMIGFKRAINAYPDLNYTFSNSREQKLLVNIAEICHPENSTSTAIKQFSALCAEYDGMKTLTPILVTVLTQVKDAIDPNWRDSGDHLSDGIVPSLATPNQITSFADSDLT